MYLYSFSNHQETVGETLSNKKKYLKNPLNRADNFVNLSLLGVEKCMEDIVLNKNTNLYISSKNGNMNSTIKILDAIFKKNQLPMPFNFLNSVNASILFFVAKSCGIEGKGIFTDTFESSFTQAYVDVKNGKTVLLGHVTEAIADLDLHRKKFGVSKISEQSQWLILSPSPKIEAREPIALISDFKLETSQKDEKNSVDNLFLFLESKDTSHSFRSKNSSFIITKC